MFRGLGVYAIGGLPSHGVYYGGYNTLKVKLQEWNDRGGVQVHPVLAQAISAVACDAAATPLWCPCEVVAKRMAIHGHTNPAYATFTRACPPMLSPMLPPAAVRCAHDHMTHA